MEMTSSYRRANIGRSRPEAHVMRQGFVVDLQHGLHARPCAALVKALRPFRCQVEVEANGERANGQSIMGLMALAAACKTVVTFTLTGNDAPQAMAAVQHLFDTRFEEAYQAPAAAAKTAAA